MIGCLLGSDCSKTIQKIFGFIRLTSVNLTSIMFVIVRVDLLHLSLVPKWNKNIH